MVGVRTCGSSVGAQVPTLGCRHETCTYTASRFMQWYKLLLLVRKLVSQKPVQPVEAFRPFEAVA
jgi:hypothetical protein